MEIIENKRQNGGRVLIDNHHFIDCVFTDCDLFYGGDLFIVEGTFYGGDLFHLLNGAHRTAGFLRMFGLVKESDGFHV